MLLTHNHTVVDAGLLRLRSRDIGQIPYTNSVIVSSTGVDVPIFEATG